MNDTMGCKLESNFETCDNFTMSKRRLVFLALGLSLGVARQAYDLTEAALWEVCGAASRAVRETEDFKEGPRAFVEKRAPRWVGR